MVHDAIEKMHRASVSFAVYTDACKGLGNAVKNVFPHAEQRECFGYMWMNVIRKFRGDEYGRLWPAARSYTKQTHAYHLGKVIASDSGFAQIGRAHV